jgi:hypothetical protein
MKVRVGSKGLIQRSRRRQGEKRTRDFVLDDGGRLDLSTDGNGREGSCRAALEGGHDCRKNRMDSLGRIASGSGSSWFVMDQWS